MREGLRRGGKGGTRVYLAWGLLNGEDSSCERFFLAQPLGDCSPIGLSPPSPGRPMFGGDLDADTRYSPRLIAEAKAAINNYLLAENAYRIFSSPLLSPSPSAGAAGEEPVYPPAAPAASFARLFRNLRDRDDDASVNRLRAARIQRMLSLWATADAAGPPLYSLSLASKRSLAEAVAAAVRLAMQRAFPARGAGSSGGDDAFFGGPDDARLLSEIAAEAAADCDTAISAPPPRNAKVVHSNDAPLPPPQLNIRWRNVRLRNVVNFAATGSPSSALAMLEPPSLSIAFVFRKMVSFAAVAAALETLESVSWEDYTGLLIIEKDTLVRAKRRWFPVSTKAMPAEESAKVTPGGGKGARRSEEALAAEAFSIPPDAASRLLHLLAPEGVAPFVPLPPPSVYCCCSAFILGGRPPPPQSPDLQALLQRVPHFSPPPLPTATAAASSPPSTVRRRRIGRRMALPLPAAAVAPEAPLLVGIPASPFLRYLARGASFSDSPLTPEARAVLSKRAGEEAAARQAAAARSTFHLRGLPGGDGTPTLHEITFDTGPRPRGGSFIATSFPPTLPRVPLPGPAIDTSSLASVRKSVAAIMARPGASGGAPPQGIAALALGQAARLSSVATVAAAATMATTVGSGAAEEKENDAASMLSATGVDASARTSSAAPGIAASAPSDEAPSSAAVVGAARGSSFSFFPSRSPSVVIGAGASGGGGVRSSMASAFIGWGEAKGSVVASRPSVAAAEDPDSTPSFAGANPLLNHFFGSSPKPLLASKKLAPVRVV